MALRIKIFKDVAMVENLQSLVSVRRTCYSTSRMLSAIVRLMLSATVEEEVLATKWARAWSNMSSVPRVKLRQKAQQLMLESIARASAEDP